MAKIKHIAIRTTDLEKTVAFYKEVFDFKQVGRGLNGIYLSDGHINLAILKYQPEKTKNPPKSASTIWAFWWRTWMERSRSLAL